MFPDQVACAENLPGEIEIPDHPLVRQTIRDCLEDAMDVEGFESVLRRLESGDIRVVARDLTEPSPLALEVLSARPYAYLDDAPLEERRTQAVMSRRWLDPESAADIGKLDADAIARVREEAWPDGATADELHDALLWLRYLTDAEVRNSNPAWPRAHRRSLAGTATRRVNCSPAVVCGSPPSGGRCSRRCSRARRSTRTSMRRRVREALGSRDEALVEIVRGRLEGLGPVTVARIAAIAFGLPARDIDTALAALQAEGFAMRGRFTPGAAEEEWCERRLLARIHRYTVKRLRAEIEPVQARDFLRFLFEWQRVHARSAHAGAGCGGRRAHAARRLRSAGERLGNGNPSRAHQRIRAGVAR